MRNKNAKVSDPNKFISNPGDRYHILYEPKVNADGTIDLVECGKEDIQEYIESFREQTDMAYIVKKVTLGDLSVLNQSVPMYGDFTDMPKTYAEALQLVIDSEKRFYELDPEIRNKFDNDYRQYMAQAGSESWFEKMSSKEKNDGSIDINVTGVAEKISDSVE